jgi:hypothetical protein
MWKWHSSGDNRRSLTSIQIEVCHRQVAVKPVNRIGDTATCLRVAGEMIRDNVLYHKWGLQASKRRVYRVYFPIVRVCATLNERIAQLTGQLRA